jgi:glycosyltransferase involved in cell wall biosynthesis
VLIGIDASRATVAQRTGTEVYSLHLIRSLLRIGAGHQFRLYFNAPPAPGTILGELELDADSRCEQRVLSFPRLWTHVRLSAEMLVHPPDVLFVPSHVLPLCHPRRSVVTVHDLGHRYHPEAHTARQRWYLEWSTLYHVRTSAHLLADSRATRDDLVRLYGADPGRVTVAYLGVDPALKPVPDPVKLAPVLRKYGITVPYVLYVGTLQPRKNLVRLIEAFGYVSGVQRPPEGGGRSHMADPSPMTHLKLALVGRKGWLSEGILGRIKDLGLEDRVVCPGFADDADLAALYSAASLFVMPSLYEGFCMPVLEAMACGAPVACSNVSSLPEVVGDAALTFDPADVQSMARAIERVFQDGELRGTMVARGFEQARTFTWLRCARQVLAVLERVGGMPASTLQARQS